MRIKIIIFLFMMLAGGIAVGIFCFLRFGLTDLATIGSGFVVLGSIISLLTYLIGKGNTRTYDDYE